MVSNQTSPLAEPFSQIFNSEAEAHWAFDFLLQTTKTLGLTGPADQRLALTVTRRSGQPALHLSFGSWLVAGFRAGGKVELVLLAQQIAWDEHLADLPFEVKEHAPEVRSYLLPLSLAQAGDIQRAFAATLPLVADKFQGWKRATPWKKHQTELVEALFDVGKRQQLFAEGLAEPELLYERQLTAFYQDVSEEGEVYEYELKESQQRRTEVRYWKIAPGKSANKWNEWRNNGYIAIGWSELGDISNLTLSEFDQKAVELGVSGAGSKQVWQFKQMNEGDRVVANRGTREVVGIGTITGSYYFDPQAEYGHQLPVKWDDLTPRPVHEPSWVKALISLDANKFEEISEGSVIEKNEYIDGAILTETTVQEPEVEPVLNQPYPLPDLAAATGFPESDLARWVRAIERKGQAILYGPPGTGKTFIAERLARHLIGGGDGFWELVQFHPAYAYEDFMQGIRPRSRDGQLSYDLEPGRFLDFCYRAEDRNDTCVLIIDEINRANLARVFGELMYLLEYREKKMELAGGGRLQIPANVRLIGTMNTADRSIALVDYALRRRFAFLALFPNFEVLRHFHQINQTGFPIERLITVLKRLNGTIRDAHYSVGITFFLRENLAGEIEDIWRTEIEPYLEEYFFDQSERLADFRWQKIKPEVLPPA